MKKIYKIALIESEKGWGRKVDDYMLCLSIEDAKLFKSEYNSKNTSSYTPDSYTQIEGEPEEMIISLAAHEYLKNSKSKRLWFREFSKMQKENVFESQKIDKRIIEINETLMLIEKIRTLDEIQYGQLFNLLLERKRYIETHFRYINTSPEVTEKSQEQVVHAVEYINKQIAKVLYLSL